MAKMMHSVMVGVAIGLFAPANAAIQWNTTYGMSAVRRLQVQTVNSHTDPSDEDCIVGGYDPNYPARVYVGSPCSLIDENGQPLSGFRWVVMETVHSTLVGSDGNHASLVRHTSSGSAFQYSSDAANVAEVGVAVRYHFSASDISEASLFLSTTSYLAKDDFTYNMNSFVVNQDNFGEKSYLRDVCVKPCAGVTPVTCSSCPSEQMVASRGMYKYSILVGAYDSVSSSTKGWEKVRISYGTGNPQQLSGDLNVYQAIDFTNMDSDTLTVTGPGQSGSINYADMDVCEMSTFKRASNPSEDCIAYDVSTITVTSDDGPLSYSFPLTYNVGDWTSIAKSYSATIAGTRTVVIKCIKPSPANLASFGLSNGAKAVFLEYKFDVTGITGSSATGKYMVYDPTVTNGNGKRSTISFARTSAGLTMLTALVMLLHVLK